MKYFTIRTVLGIGTGNSSAVVSVVPSDRSSKRGALLGPKRHPKCQDRTSTGVRPYAHDSTASRQLIEVKHHAPAQLGLRWVTTLEPWVLQNVALFEGRGAMTAPLPVSLAKLSMCSGDGWLC